MGYIIQDALMKCSFLLILQLLELLHPKLDYYLIHCFPYILLKLNVSRDLLKAIFSAIALAPSVPISLQAINKYNITNRYKY